jgi:hemolysin III
LASDSGHPKFPTTRFVAAIFSELAVALALFWLIAPRAFGAEVARPWHIVGWTVLFGLPLSLFEYLYHRYLLHSAVLPFMASMHRAHGVHHGLTYVKAPVTPNEPAKLVEVRSEFSVEEPEQEESMMFPLWSLPIFYAVFLIVLAMPLKFVFPHQPILISVILASTFFYCAYEIWHAILHLPFEKFWQPMMERPATRAVTRHMYSFHLMHHWRPSSNNAIVGFWGLALWDHAFRTHRRPERIPLDGADVNYHDASLPKPLFPIALLDRWQLGLYKASRATERYLARTFLRRRSD